jgi:hypothetical protein
MGVRSAGWNPSALYICASIEGTTKFSKLNTFFQLDCAQTMRIPSNGNTISTSAVMNPLKISSLTLTVGSRVFLQNPTVAKLLKNNAPFMEPGSLSPFRHSTSPVPIMDQIYSFHSLTPQVFKIPFNITLYIAQAFEDVSSYQGVSVRIL